ncbi:hypothetical protein E2C01_095207 [Portunus trituberculatus]|uniref:Uncharacterized protein n=1 Tax=Portunus trituberculatus TaxID=210409 RepID=A0A5B7JP83_PORTR|nr:hypothetical protein [Portunus trituberculatus]
MYEVFVRENTAPVVLLTLHATTNTSDIRGEGLQAWIGDQRCKKQENNIL